VTALLRSAVLLVALAGGATAATRPPEPAISWPGGECTLARAIGLLDATGNTTVIGDGGDPSRRARLPFIEGSYWQAVLAVCAAFDLELAPASERTRSDLRDAAKGDTGLLVVTGGTVVLRPRARDADAPDLSPQGELLVVVDDAGLYTTRTVHTVDAAAFTAWRVRLPPRSDVRGIASATVTWRTVRNGTGRRLRVEGATGGDVRLQPGIRVGAADGAPRAVVGLHGISAHTRGWRLEGVVRIRRTERKMEVVEVTMPGRAPIDLGTTAGTVWLAENPADAPQRLPGPGAGIDLPTDSFDNTTLGLVVMDGKNATLTTRGRGIFKDGGTTTVNVGVTDLQAGQRYRVGVSAQVVAEEIVQPLQVTVRLNGHGAADRTGPTP
jgi:hypothetical protein